MFRLGWRFCAHPAERHWQGASLCGSLQQGDLLSKSFSPEEVLWSRGMGDKAKCVCVRTCGYLTFTAYASFINNSQLQVHEDWNSSLIGSNAGEDFGGLKGRRGGSRKVKWSTEEDWRLLAFLDFSIEIERLASSLGVPPSNTRQAWGTRNTRLLFVNTPAFSTAAKSSHYLAMHVAHWFGTDGTGARGQPYAARTSQNREDSTFPTARPGVECSQAFASQSQTGVNVRDRKKITFSETENIGKQVWSATRPNG